MLLTPAENGNTSATGGALLPAAPLPVDDADLDAVFQTLVSSVTGLPGNLVLPRWQPVVPKQPEPGTNWCAIGVVQVHPNQEGPWISFDQVNFVGLLWDYEDLDVLVSFYGPNSQAYARLLRAGLALPQNDEQLEPYGMRYVGCERMTQIPELINQQWVKRQDMALQFRRKAVLTYPVTYFLSAIVNLIDDVYGIDDTITLTDPLAP